MIPNCIGCKEEFGQALYYQEKGLYFATSLDKEFVGRKHFAILMVDDDGNIQVW